MSMQHALQRAAERTDITSKEIQQARNVIKRIKLRDGDFYLPYKNRGFIAIRVKNGRNWITTVLKPNWRPKGKSIAVEYAVESMMRKTPGLKHARAVIDRVPLDDSFKPTWLAIPERGQSTQKSWRSDLGYHLHEHGDKLIAHRDAHAVGLKHMVEEGLPGAMEYFKQKKTMLQRLGYKAKHKVEGTLIEKTAANLTYGQRAAAGFHWEDQIAAKLKRKGHKVKVMPRNHPFDLLVDEKIKIDVKASVWTSYKGSDGYPISGWVFSNMKHVPTADFYVMVCLTKGRLAVEKMYVIPSDMAKQRTLTVTKRDKYRMYIDGWEQLKLMRKNAFMMDIAFQQDAPMYAYGASQPFAQPDQPEERAKIEGKKILFKLVGAVAGGITAIALSRVTEGRPLIPAGNYLELGKQEAGLGLIGAAIGTGLAKRFL